MREDWFSRQMKRVEADADVRNWPDSLKVEAGYITRVEENVVCIFCNDQHPGAVIDHPYESVEGAGYIRLLVIGQQQRWGEFCWRCSCRKSGWENLPNQISDHCAAKECPCHTMVRAR